MPAPQLQSHFLVVQPTLVRLLQSQIGILLCNLLLLDLFMGIAGISARSNDVSEAAAALQEVELDGGGGGG